MNDLWPMFWLRNSVEDGDVSLFDIDAGQFNANTSHNHFCKSLPKHVSKYSMHIHEPEGEEAT